MAGVTLDQLPVVVALGGAELFWLYQPTGNPAAPWAGKRCTLSQIAAFRSGVTTVAALPAGGDGDASFVTDLNAPAAGNFGSPVVGGGTNHVPVYYDGGAAAWRIG